MKREKKQNQLSVDEYAETYCQEKRIRRRRSIYISEETHHNLRTVAAVFKNKYFTTTSSLADSILHSHFEAHGDLLNRELDKDSEHFHSGLKSHAIVSNCEGN